MSYLQLFILLMSIAVILVGIALKLRIPYPLTLIIGGVGLGFMPGLNDIPFDPDLVLVLVLPPILYYGAYTLPFKEFHKHLKDILWLALGLVIVTTFVMGVLFKWFFPTLPWAVAFTFGAIISPPDAVAATAILRRFRLSSRLLTVLEGESLINDATGLLLYRLAIVALLSGTFSWGAASFEFVKIAGGGILIGAVTGYLLHAFSSRFFDPILAVVYSFTIPYLTFILADWLEVSGVLAVVINGLIGSRMLVTHFGSLTRVVEWAAWDIFVIFLNCFVFILIGLQLHDIIQRLTVGEISLYLGYGLVLTGVAILVRFVWVYFREGMNYWIAKRNHTPTRHVLSEVMILSWAGMRGIVSLTLALGLPFTLPNGTPFPGRDIVILLSFVIIFLTLLIPSLSFPTLMRQLDIRQTTEDMDTKTARQELIRAAQQEIRHLYNSQHLDDQEYSFLLTYFSMRHQMLEMAAKTNKNTNKLEYARLQVLNRKRQCLLTMWESNEIGDQLFNLLEREIDLEEANLARPEIT